jgi:hypothetical protein
MALVGKVALDTNQECTYLISESTRSGSVVSNTWDYECYDTGSNAAEQLYRLAISFISFFSFIVFLRIIWQIKESYQVRLAEINNDYGNKRYEE